MVHGLVFLAFLAPPPLVAPTEALDPGREAAGFRLPAGFEAKLVVAEPDIAKPMNLAWDDRGRLWVTDTLEYPYPAKPGAKPRDTLRVLSDFDPVTGRARKVSTFADGLNIPIGVLPLPSGKTTRCIVYHINQVLLLEDADGDGVAERRETLLEGFGSADTHGMTNSFTWAHDGGIHATHGFANDSKVRDRTGRVLAMQSGHTYRFLPDGTGLELWTRGQVNPFGMARDDAGRLFTADCHSRPLYSLIRGACYPSFAKPHDGLGFGPEMCPHDHGSTGIAGCCWIPKGFWAPADNEQLLIGNVVTSRVNRDDIRWSGSSPKAVETPDLIVSEDLWFRPVDLKLGPDGALYVADFYNRIIGHYEVPLSHPGRDRHRGRIWRVAPKGLPAVFPDLGAGADSNALIAGLGNRNPTVATLSLNQLAGRGAGPVSALKSAWSKAGWPEKVNIAWALERLGSLDESKVAELASAPEAHCRIHGMSLAIRAGRQNTDRLLVLGLKDPDPQVRRAAAEAASASGGTSVVTALAEAHSKADANDQHLRHSILVALRNRLASGGVEPESALVEAHRALLVSAALGIPDKKASGFLSGQLDKALPAARPEIVRHVSRHGGAAEFESLEKSVARDGLAPTDRARLLVEMEKGAGQAGRSVPKGVQELAGRLAKELLGQSGTRLEGIELAGAFRVEADRLATILADRSLPEQLRMAALRALGGKVGSGREPVFSTVLADSDAPVALRQECGLSLVRSDNPAARKSATEALTGLPSGLQDAMARELAIRRDGCAELIEMVARGKVSARVLTDRVVASRIDALKDKALSEKTKSLSAGLPAVDAALVGKIAAVRAAASSPGSKAQGAELFSRHCAACHQVAGKGAKVGPQLDGVAARGLERLAEDIFDPNRNVDQAFRTTVVSLKDGRVVSGLLLRQEGQTIVLADAMGKEVVVKLDEIEERKISPLSPMPAGLADRLAPRDLVDLMAYLASPGG